MTMASKESYMNAVTANDVIEALNLLLAPSSDNSEAKSRKRKESKKDSALHHLQQNLHKLQTELSGGRFLSLGAALKETERDVRSDMMGTSTEWLFVSCILQLLHLLPPLILEVPADDVDEKPSDEILSEKKQKRPQDAPPSTKGALSVAHLSTVKSAIQIVFSLGVCPNLIPGVGISLQHRSELTTSVLRDCAALAKIRHSSECNQAKLSVCVCMLVDLLRVPELKLVIVNSHLNDLLAALLQLLYVMNRTENVIPPNSVPPENYKSHSDISNKEKRTSLAAEDSGSVQESSYPDPILPSEKAKDSTSAQLTDTDKKSTLYASTERTLSIEAERIGQHRQALDNLVSSVRPSLLIRELLVLQAGGPPKPQAIRKTSSADAEPPKWLKKSCSHQLLRLAKGKKGIQHLYDALSADSDSSSSTIWKHCGVVARIIAGCPVTAQQLDVHLTNISQQLMELLNSQGKDTAHLLQLAGAVASSMTQKYEKQFSRHFHHHLLQPLLWCLENQEENVNGSVAMSELEMIQCLMTLHKVYIRAQPPQSSIICALRPVIGVIWVLFCITRSAVYSIKKTVRELLMCYLKFLGRAEAASCLQQLCVGPAVDGTSNYCMSLTVCFEAGSRGSLQAVYAEANKVTKVSEEQKVEAVIDVLGDLKKDKVAGELLVILLKEMTKMISKESQQPDIVLPAGVQRAEVNELRSEEIMRKVTHLHLLAAICETLGAECLSDNTQILLFVRAALEKSVAVCQSTSEEETAIFETEMLSMVMGLVTAVLASAVELEEKDRNLLEGLMPLLEVVSQGHPDEFIQEMATDIRVAIATRGAVWPSLQQNKKGNKKSKSNKTDIQKSKESTKEVKTDNCKTKSSQPLIEVLSEHSVSDPQEQLAGKQSSTREFPSKTSVEESSKQSSELLDANMSLAPNQICQSKPLIEVVSGETSSVPKLTTDKDHDSDSSSATNTVLSPVKDSMAVSSSHQQIAVSEMPSESPVDVETVKHLEEFSQEILMNETAEAESEQIEDANQHQSTEKSPLQTVFEELCDPLIPVRGHALIMLARLVQEGNAETLAKKDVVQKVFEENLHHGDSYLYLSAISGMSALADRFPEPVVQSLAAEFAGFSKKSAYSLTAEHRLKVGEALMKAIRNLGETVPRYRELLLGAVLTGARDKDATVRASSVSNLAEICSLLRFSLGSVLQEVFHCCSSLLETDEAIVRQAAAMTLNKMLEGLSKDSFTVLESVLLKLYRLLKKVSAVDKDEAVQLHVSLALEQLDTITRDFAFPKQTLQKRIQVLPDADTFR